MGERAPRQTLWCQEICRLMFGLGKWKLLWRVRRRIRPLLSNSRCARGRGDRCAHRWEEEEEEEG